MGLLRHIVDLNRHDLRGFCRLWIGPAHIGWVRHALAARLLDAGGAMARRGDDLEVRAAEDTPDGLTAAVDTVLGRLADAGDLPLRRGEPYRVDTGWGTPVLMTLDRAWVSALGVRAYGVHLNGMVHRPDGVHLWVAKRSRTKSVAPGRLDNIVAGGQPAGLSLRANLLKEAAEEADLPADLMAGARPVGSVTYCLETRLGLKPDVLFCYDLALPAAVAPRNTDGEIEAFALWPARDVLAAVRATDRFKFNVPLTVIDWALRHGLIDPDTEPDALALAAGLHAPLPFPGPATPGAAGGR